MHVIPERMKFIYEENRYTVFLFDRNDRYRWLFDMILKAQGHNVIASNSLEEIAKQLAERQKALNENIFARTSFRGQMLVASAAEDDVEGIINISTQYPEHPVFSIAKSKDVTEKLMTAAAFEVCPVYPPTRDYLVKRVRNYQESFKLDKLYRIFVKSDPKLLKERAKIEAK